MGDKNMRKKIILILAFLMIFLTCFSTIHLANETTNTKSKNSVVSNVTDNKQETKKKNQTTTKANTNKNQKTNSEKVPATQKQETKVQDTKSKKVEKKEQPTNQARTVTKTDAKKTLENGTYRIQSKLNQKRVLEVEGKSTGNAKKVKLANKLSVSMSQNVIVKYLNNGYYSLTFENSKKVLDVAGASKKKGTLLQQYQSNNTAAQQWILKSDGKGYYSIISRCNGLYLDVPGARAGIGANIQLYTGNGTDAQKFKFEKVQAVKSEKTIEEGVYYISSALSNNKVLTIADGRTSNAVNLHIESKIGKQCQKFRVSYDNNLKAYTITAFHSDKVLDVSGAGQTNGTNVQQYSKNKTKAQQWIIKKTSDGYYSIISKCNYLYLDLSGASTRNGNNIQVYEPNNTKAQKFKFQKINTNITCNQVLKNGVYKISSALNGRKALDIAESSKKNGANLQLWDSNNVAQQKFQITYHANGKYYEIKAIHSMKPLAVAGNRKIEGTNVYQYATNNSNDKKWVLKDAGNGYFYIVAVYSGLYLDVSGANTRNGTNVQVYRGNSTKAQKFKFTKIQTISSGDYQIVMKQNTNKALDVSDASYADKANLQIWNKANVAQQIFTIKPIDNTYYKIIAKHSKKVLTVDSNNNVVQSTDKNANYQKWIFEIAENGCYRIKLKGKDLYLDVSGNKTANGTNVQVHAKNNSGAQLFRLNKVTERNGIDVSFYQNLINWSAVKRTKYSDFTMIRAGYRGYGSSGKLVTDTQFMNNVKGAKANGIPIGLYFFTQAVNTKEAVQEANYVLNLVKLAKTYGVTITYPIAIDTETANGGAGRADRLDVRTRTAVCKAFCDTIRKAGYTPAIYASRDWFYNNLDMNQLKGYDIWVAHYTGSASNKTNYKYNYAMWQYTSAGKVNGIGGNVDLNICYKNY